RRGDGAARLAKAGGFEQPNGNAEIGAVGQVENLRAECELALRDKGQSSANGQVQLEQIARAKAVARYSARLPEGSEQSESVGRQEPQRAEPVAGDHQAIGRVQPIRQVAVQIHVEDAAHRERLSGLKLS